MDANELLKLSERHPIVLFDGVCNLCDGFVQFVMKRDKAGIFRFAPLQSEAGRVLLRHFNLDEAAMDTVVLIENGALHTKSTAALRTVRNIGGVWGLGYTFIILPKFIRNSVYDFIAKNRYRWFGKKDACMIPTPEVRARFLE